VAGASIVIVRTLLRSVDLAVVILTIGPAITEVLLDDQLEVSAAEPVCNGYAELCDRPYNEVVYAATHNSMSISTQGWVWPLHDIGIASQLQSGIRALLIDTHYWDDVKNADGYLADLPPNVRPIVQDALDDATFLRRPGTFLCHGLCTLGGTSMVSALEEIRAFMDTHPREVITLLIQDDISPEDTAQAFEDSGLLDYIYAYDGGDWATLGEMIDTGQRLVIMAENQGPPPDWYLNMWDYTQETPYAFKSPDGMSCEPNRGGTDKPLFLLNHWIDRVSPDRVDAARINAYDFLLKRSEQCADERGKMPNYIAVNFSVIGDVIPVVNQLNGVASAQ
jgi:hypothetical protein